MNKDVNDQIAFNRDFCNLEYIVKCNPHCTFWKDQNSVYLGCNEKFANLLGKSVAEIIMLVSKVPLISHNGECLGILGVSVDITEQKKLQQEVEAFAAQAAQVAHDIRSPLAALSVIAGNLKDIPESARIILRDSVNRINDIANNLLTNYKNQYTAQNEDKLQSWLVASLLESIISEKKLQHQHVAMEAHISSAAYFIFAHFNAIEMKRVISNIVNNSAEAFENEDGKIIISLDVENNQVILKIIDNGCGISEEKLARVFQEGVSFKQHGSGLGLSHAKKSI